MKKLIFFVLALFAMSNVFAQTSEEMAASKARLAKMEKLVKMPKSTGLSSIDALAVNCGAIAANSVEITPLLQGMYYRSMGQNNEGVIDVTVKKPTVAEATELSLRIAAQALLVKQASELVKGAGEELKTVTNPLKLKAPTSCLKYSKDVLEIAAAETAFQVKAIAEMIKTLSNSGNL